LILYRLPDPIPRGPPHLPETALYNSLQTNIPLPLMAYREFPFPPSTSLFPKAGVMLQYLEAYARHFDLQRHINFSTKVIGVEQRNTDGGPKWSVTTQAGDGPDAGRTVWSNVDTIFVGNGRHEFPYFPSSLPGLSEWVAGGKATHSMSYREPSSYLGKTIMVAGNGPSANDISPEIAGVAKVVYRSMRNKVPNTTGAIFLDSSTLQVLSKMIECANIQALEDMESGMVSLVDGETITGVDHVIFATGYDMSFPFLDNILKEDHTRKMGADPDLETLTNVGSSMSPLSMHMIPLCPSIPIGSLFFLGLPRPVILFPLAEAQCLLARAILTGEIHLDVEDETTKFEQRRQRMMEEYNGNLEQVSAQWLRLYDAKQFEYRRELVELCKGDVEYWVPNWWKRIEGQWYKLRAIWKDLEKDGKADEMIKDVGKGGELELVELMTRLLHSGNESVPKKSRIDTTNILQ
jgi:hypothetical protein